MAQKLIERSSSSSKLFSFALEPYSFLYCEIMHIHYMIRHFKKIISPRDVAFLSTPIDTREILRKHQIWQLFSSDDADKHILWFFVLSNIVCFIIHLLGCFFF